MVKAEPSARIKSIDELRGFAIASMILVNFLAIYPAVPSILKHAKGVGFTFADLVAPLFMFIIGIMYRRSVLKRAATDGRIKTWLHLAQRYALLCLLGLLGNWVALGSIGWGVLQAIGLAGIIVLPVIENGRQIRFTAALGLMGFYQTLLFTGLKETILKMDHGGPLAVLSWSTILLWSSLAGDFIDFDKIAVSVKQLTGFGLIFFSVGMMASVFIPISKHEVNLSYILVATGFSALLLVIFMIACDMMRFSVPTFETIGKNALLVYLLHYLLVQIGHFLIPSTSAFPWVAFGAVAIYFMIYRFALFLEKKLIYFRL